MSKRGAGISLTSYDDIFATDESRAEDKLEKVQLIPVEELFPFKDHPFKVRDDEDMQKTVESIKEYGVLTPAIARPREGGGYEIISGHRRHHAAQLAGLKEIPVIVRDMDDDAATILMVDANLQRETILPSERAQAYKMKLEAIKHQGERLDLSVDKPKETKRDEPDGTCRRVVDKLKAADIIGQDTGESGRQVQRYIRLTELIPELQEMVDEKKIAFNPAVEISYLSKKEQQGFIDAMDYSQATPSLSQAQRLKKLSQDGKCTPEAMCAVMDEEKKPPRESVVFSTDSLRKYFPRDYTAKQMESTIVKLLDQWQRRKERDKGMSH